MWGPLLDQSHCLSARHLVAALYLAPVEALTVWRSGAVAVLSRRSQPQILLSRRNGLPARLEACVSQDQHKLKEMIDSFKGSAGRGVIVGWASRASCSLMALACFSLQFSAVEISFDPMIARALDRNHWRDFCPILVPVSLRCAYSHLPFSSRVAHEILVFILETWPTARSRFPARRGRNALVQGCATTRFDRFRCNVFSHSAHPRLLQTLTRPRLKPSISLNCIKALTPPPNWPITVTLLRVWQSPFRLAAA